MTWTCSECRQDFQLADKKYKFNLCHICYFNPAIAKLYRTGEKQPLPDEPPALVEPKPVEGVTGLDDGLCLVSQASDREMDDDTFQLRVRNMLRCRYRVKETGRWSAANPPQSAMPRAESFLEQLSKPPMSDAQLASLRAMHQELACEGK